MTYLADLPAVLADWDLEVTTLSGAATRGSSSINPSVIVVHDDIIGGCPTSMPGAIRSGVQQPTQYVPGPLYNIWINCTGRVVLAADGVANNAGEGSSHGFTGNSRTIGICRSHHPDVAAATRAQNDATATVTAVVLTLIDRPTDRAVGHKEWTTRKSDPWDVAMGDFRKAVAERRVRPMSPQERRKLLELAASAAEGRRMLRGRPVPMRGRDVRELQYALSIRPTGIYGPRTIAKVKALQAWLDIDVDRPGRVNRSTWEAVYFFFLARAWGYVA